MGPNKTRRSLRLSHRSPEVTGSNEERNRSSRSRRRSVSSQLSTSLSPRRKSAGDGKASKGPLNLSKPQRLTIKGRNNKNESSESVANKPILEEPDGEVNAEERNVNSNTESMTKVSPTPTQSESSHFQYSYETAIGEGTRNSQNQERAKSVPVAFPSECIVKNVELLNTRPSLNQERADVVSVGSLLIPAHVAGSQPVSLVSLHPASEALGKTASKHSGSCDSSLGPNLVKLTSEIFQTLPFKLSLKDIESKVLKEKTVKVNEHGKEGDSSVNLHQLDMISLTDKVVPQKKQTKKSDPSELATELRPHIDANDVYFKMDRKSLKPVEMKTKSSSTTKILKRSALGPDLEKKEFAPLILESANQKRKLKRKQREETAGPNWYNLPKTEVTPELKKDFQLMKMRDILDPHRHYKKSDSTLPRYFQMGTVIEGSAEFYSSRISKKQRKGTLVDELLADAEFRKKNKKKYLEIQKVKQSGGKGYYKKRKNKGKPTWARS